jgi:hypothetical protein
MGMIIFFMAVIDETAFVAFCMITKSNHARERSRTIVWSKYKW